MPTLSFFHGIVIQMFTRGHPPPHFHARYGEHKATYAIAALERETGWMPAPQERLILKWAIEHQKELMEDWSLCEAAKLPLKIQPMR